GERVLALLWVRARTLLNNFKIARLAVDTPFGPVLTSARPGRRRALVLARICAGSGVRHAYSRRWKRGNMSEGGSTVLFDGLRAASSGNAVDVDLTVFVLVALFLFLMWHLNRALFQPYLSMKEERFSRIQGAKAQAKDMAEQAQKTLDDYEEKLTDARQEAVAVRTDLRKSAKETEAEILADARRELDEVMSKSRAEIDAAVDEAEAGLHREAENLSELIVTKVMV
ncbi:MAG: ATP synthase F0 subunit B, partial [Myxococcales bacterium]|nr:ATP synthase F0 subunit B [Myxococcales bacterium]